VALLRGNLHQIIISYLPYKLDFIIIFDWEQWIVCEGELSQHQYCSKNCLVVRDEVSVWSCQDCPILEPLIYRLDGSLLSDTSPLPLDQGPQGHHQFDIN